MVYEYLTILLAFVSAILGILLLLEKKERKKESGKHADYKKRRNRGQRGKIKGEYTEILLPWAKKETGCNGSELHHLGKPIDFIGFEGKDDPKTDIQIKFIEVKSGKSPLSHNQKRIKEAINKKNIEWLTIRINPKEALESVDVKIET